VSDELGSVLSRWSQRKHAARLAERDGVAPAALKEADESIGLDVQPVLAPDADANLPAEPVTDEQQQAEGSPADARPPLTPIEDLTPESDYTQFLADHVPEALQRAALRKLWTSDPVLACLDGLNDYDEDFNVIDTAISAADTSYKVGRGFLDTDEPEVAEAPEPVVVASGEDKPAVELPDSESESESRPVEAAGEDDPQRSTHERVTSQRVGDGSEDPQSDTTPDNLPGSTG
jgi:Protein of unknown function (DUF3306)